MTDTHELAEKIFIASIANPHWTQRNIPDSNLAGWAYDAAREFIAVKEKNTALNVAQPEQTKLPDYKPGQIIVVWDDDSEVPCLRKFKEFQDGKIRVSSDGSLHNTEFGWPNHCTLEELPEVLAKLGEKK